MSDDLCPNCMEGEPVRVILVRESGPDASVVAKGTFCPVCHIFEDDTDYD